jgi:hypothetical protein
MTKEQVIRIQREILPGSGHVPNGEPFLTYGIWVLPFSRDGIGVNVFLIDRETTSESEHVAAKEEATKKLSEAISRPEP